MTTKPRRVRVYLEDNSFVLVPKNYAKDFVGITEYNDLIVRCEDPILKGGFLGLTNCCGATAKGCDGYVGCRNCYRECESMLGAPLDENDIYLKIKVGA